MKAFPNQCNEVIDGVTVSQNGMDLRDYFAAKALPIAWDAYDKGYTATPENAESSIASHAYQLADAMMEARELSK